MGVVRTLLKEGQNKSIIGGLELKSSVGLVSVLWLDIGGGVGL